MTNNNNWAGLSQREKAQLISIYTKHGYTKLSDITNHYNKFQSGGNKGDDEEYYDVINHSVVTASLPDINTKEGKRIAKSIAYRIANGQDSLSNVPRKYYNYVQGELQGAMPVTKAINDAGKNIYDVVDTATAFMPGPVGTINWLAHMGADAAHGNYGKVAGDLAMAGLMGYSMKGVGKLASKINNQTYNRFINGIANFLDDVTYDTSKDLTSNVKALNRDASKKKLTRLVNDELQGNIESFTGNTLRETTPVATNYIAHQEPLSTREMPTRPISEAERLGLPKIERNAKTKTSTARSGSRYFLDSEDLFPLDYSEVIPEEAFVPNWMKVYKDSYRYTKDRGVDLLDGLKSDNDDVIDRINKFAESLSDYNKRFARKDGRPSFYVSQFRDYFSSLGYDTSGISDENILKIISHRYADLSSGATGKLKGRLVFHGSSAPHETFDYSLTGSNTGNMGYNGAGNYFATYPTTYGARSGQYIGYVPAYNQPYMITGIKSTPISTWETTLPIPEYRSPSSPTEYKQYIDDAVKLADLGKTKNMAIIDGRSKYPQQVYTYGNTIPISEFSVSRNTGIKSLFPSPDMFVETENGVTLLPVDWTDLRVNHKQGGYLNRFDNGGIKDFIEKIKQAKIDRIFRKKIQPVIDKLGIDEVRMRLYTNLDPFNYSHAKERLKDVISRESNYNLKEENGESNFRDNIFAEYLQIPEYYRRQYSTDAPGKVIDSQYSPSMHKDDHYYKAINLSNYDKQELIDAAFGSSEIDYLRPLPDIQKNKHKILDFGENKVTDSLGKYFATHTVGRGLDPYRGEYISYYDKWDLAPYKGLGEDESHGIGSPIEFYDRIYLNDYYGINPEIDGYYGGYIKPAVITEIGNKYNIGGDKNNEENDILYNELYGYIEPAILNPRISALNLSRMANAKPNNNFSHAQDMTPAERKRANLSMKLTPRLRGLLNFDPRTCINTVTGFYGVNTVASNKKFTDNPNKYGFREISQEEVLPGDIIVLSDKNNHPHHAVIFDSIADDYGEVYDYPVTPGDTLLNYSNGGVGIENYRHASPMSKFHDPEYAGGDFSGKKRYYRYDIDLLLNTEFKDRLDSKNISDPSKLNQNSLGGKLNKYDNGGNKTITYNTQFPFENNMMYAPQSETEPQYRRESIQMKPYNTEVPIDLEEILNRQRYKESTFNDKAKNKVSGAIGAFQITPIVKKQYEDKYGKIGDLSIYENNKKVRDYYMQWLSERPYLQGLTESVAMAKQLAAYNWGIGNVKKALEKAKSKSIDIEDSFDWLDEMPQETRNYVNFILLNQDINEAVNNKDYQERLDRLR